MILESNYNNWLSWIKKKQLQNKDAHFDILLSNEEKELKYTLKELPHLSVIQLEFDGDSEIYYQIYFNSNIIKTGKLMLSIEKEEKAVENNNIDINSILKNQQILMESLLKNERSISEARIQSIQEIHELKFQSMKQSFDDLLENQKKIYEMRLDIEREKMESESNIETSTVIVDTIKDIVNELIPIGKAYIESYVSKNNEITIPKGL